uniref:Uncharacterized protein n=1 Tax=Rhizophora mucronata TaxID=61149 RepID=A0A2P2PCI3_RHIMU
MSENLNSKLSEINVENLHHFPLYFSSRN